MRGLGPPAQQEGAHGERHTRHGAVCGLLDALLTLEGSDCCTRRCCTVRSHVKANRSRV